MDHREESLSEFGKWVIWQVGKLRRMSHIFNYPITRLLIYQILEVYRRLLLNQKTPRRSKGHGIGNGPESITRCRA